MALSNRIFHILAFFNYAFALTYDLFIMELPNKNISVGSEDFGGRWKYLTVWDVALQMVFFAICVAHDFLGLVEAPCNVDPEKRTQLHRLKDWFFASLALPLAILVTSLFWILYAIDRELVFPKVLDTFFPGWLNHAMHSAPLFFIGMELMISYHHYPTRWRGLMGLGCYMAAYLIWLQIIAHVSGFWVYPILEIMNWWQYILFTMVVAGATFAFYFAGEFLNTAIWVVEDEHPQFFPVIPTKEFSASTQPLTRPPSQLNAAPKLA